MPRPRPHCARWGPSPLPRKGGITFSIFGPCLLWPMSFEVGLCPGHIVLDGNPAAPSQKWGTAANFRPMSIVAKRQDGSTCHLVWGRPWSRPHCSRWGPALLPRKGDTVSQIFGPCLLWPNGWMDQDTTWYGGRPRPRRRCDRWGPSSP